MATEALLLRLLPVSMEVDKIFEKKVFVFDTSIPIDEQTSLKKRIEDRGGKIFKSKIDPHSIVLFKAAPPKKGSVFNRCKEKQAPLVELKWVEDCIQQSKLIEHESHTPPPRPEPAQATQEEEEEMDVDETSTEGEHFFNVTNLNRAVRHLQC